MDPVRFGRQLRALRRRKRWRQDDLADAAGVSRSVISRIEQGGGDRHTMRTLRLIAGALSARVECRLLWNGEALDRLLDEAHSAIVEALVRRLERHGWVVVPEASFSIFGERGSIDVLAWHERAAALLVVEVKSAVPDIQGLLSNLDRKARLGAEAARPFRWKPRSVSRLLVVGEGRTGRRRVAGHEATFRTVLPDRGRAVWDWIRAPESRRRIDGLVFLSVGRGHIPRHRIRVTPRATPERDSAPNVVSRS
jgi:transcriptional regulator with XRE-family HTH domain